VQHRQRRDQVSVFKTIFLRQLWSQTKLEPRAFVLCKPVQPGVSPVAYPRGEHLKGRLRSYSHILNLNKLESFIRRQIWYPSLEYAPALLAIIRLVLKDFTGTNNLAYFAPATDKENSLKTLIVGSSSCRATRPTR
jgi:hypothetical protein